MLKIYSRVHNGCLASLYFDNWFSQCGEDQWISRESRCFSGEDCGYSERMANFWRIWVNFLKLSMVLERILVDFKSPGEFQRPNPYPN